MLIVGFDYEKLSEFEKDLFKILEYTYTLNVRELMDVKREKKSLGNLLCNFFICILFSLFHLSYLWAYYLNFISIHKGFPLFCWHKARRI